MWICDKSVFEEDKNKQDDLQAGNTDDKNKTVTGEKPKLSRNLIILFDKSKLGNNSYNEWYPDPTWFIGNWF